MTRPDIYKKLARARQSYASKLPHKVADINKTWQQLQCRPDNRDILATLQLNCHRLAGSGSSFGYSKTSEAAKSLDDIFLEIQASGNALLSSNTQRVQQLLKTLETSIKTPDFDITINREVTD